MGTVSGGASLIRANARAIPLADESVDLIVTSPPYFALRSYQDGGEHFDAQIGSELTPQEFLESLWTVTAEMRRVLKSSGSIFVNLGDKYAGSGGHNNAGLSTAGSTLAGTRQQDRGGASATEYARATRRNAPDRYNQSTNFTRQSVPDRTASVEGITRKSLLGLPWRYAIGCVDDLDLVLRAEIIWDKPNGVPESVTDRVRRSHEQWFHFTKCPLYYSDTSDIREPSSGYHRGAVAIPEIPGQKKRQMRHTTNPKGRVPGSVWEVSSEPLKVPEDLDVDHFAAFPQEFPRRFILGWSPENGVVLDPFVGTGTVPMVARALNRFGIGLDLSQDYLKLAHWRVFKSGHALKSVGRTWGERQGALL